MSNIFNSNIIWSISIIASLFAIIAGHRLTTYRDRKNRFNNAAAKFRGIIQSSLEGVYPNTESHLSIEEKDTITQNSINPINSAGSEFSHYIFIFRKSKFNKALSNYCDTARKINWDECMSRKRFPNTNFPETDQERKFKDAVNSLIEFTK